MKEKFQQYKEQFKAVVSKMNSKTKKIIIAGMAGLVIFAIVLAVLLNRRPKDYEVLFSGLSAEGTQQVIGKLQESEIDYQYNNNGDILVPSSVIDQTRAELALEGYPKDGLGYSIYLENTGLMTTDSDKARYELYDLQNRMAATIMLIDGVRDATVSIALGEDSKYVLSDTDTQDTTASVVVTMEDGGSPTTQQVKAMQRLVSFGVAGLEEENVAVVDSNGNDLTNTEEEEQLTSQDSEEVAQLVESQISSRVMNVLAPFYGEENIRISSKAQINMQTLVRESITYTTPDKIDEEDKEGLISHTSGGVEISGSKDAVASGVAGSETNSDIPEYDTGDDEEGVEGYGNRYWDTDYLINQIKEQGQVTPGALEDLTISVAINGDSYGTLTANDIRALVGNAAGIREADWNSKISVVSAPFYQPISEPEEEEEGFSPTAWFTSPIFFIVLAVVLILLVVALVLFILGSKRKKKKRLAEEEAAALAAAQLENDSAFNQELIDFQNDRGMELKQNLREFTEENPEISAQLLRTWLNGVNKDGE